MAVEDHTGRCRTCGGPAYRVPNQLPDTPDRWVHLNARDWSGDAHDVDPQPAEPNTAR